MVEFILNNELIRTDVHAGVTLLDFIREHKHLKGTKIGCREGDCGACSVLVGKFADGQVTYEGITSCISPLGNAHGKHIVTIEGINLDGKLNTVQHAMTDQYATQCGFCTPGFVVSMTGYALAPNKAKLRTCNDAISGNICRCTGYKSIEKAGQIIEEKLLKKNTKDSINWLIEQEFIPNYFEGIPARLEALETKPLVTNGRIVANGTDLYVRNADVLADEEVHLITNKDVLHGIDYEENTCTIGANTTVTDLLENEGMHVMIPNFSSYIKLVSSDPIRNMGTIGGNFVNASPIGDMTIFFMALHPTLTLLKDDETERNMAFNTFYKGYKDYDLRVNELVKSISFERLEKGDYFNFEKVCKRTHLDIASVNSAAKITMKDGVVSSAHFSMGGVAAVPAYLFETSAYFTGKRVTPAIILEAEKVLQSEISPISDVRGAKAYKRLLARQLFFAHFLRLFPAEIQLQNLLS